MAAVACCARLALAGIAGALVLLGLSAPLASAHSVAGASASNYRTTLVSVAPAVPGLSLTVIEAGSRLQLRNDTGRDVVVVGYEGEPYLRVGPAGVFENRRSPATYLNASRRAGGAVPPEADPKAGPDWQLAAAGTTARWHDHRTHWMGSERPRQVQADPGRRRQIGDDWTVELRDGPTIVTATGRLEWVPGPSPWPWLAAALLLGAAVGLSVWRLRRLTLPAAAALTLIVVDAAHIVGIARESAGGLGAQLGKLVSTSYLSIVAWVVLGTAVFYLRHRPTDGYRLAALGAVLVATGGGVADIAYLWHSTIPFAGPADAARGLVTATLGIGLGLAAGSVAATFAAQVPATRLPNGPPGTG